MRRSLRFPEETEHCMSIKKPAPVESPDAKMRICLSCQNPFNSSWAGERICPKCKNSAAWRSGTRALAANRSKG